MAIEPISVKLKLGSKRVFRFALPYLNPSKDLKKTVAPITGKRVIYYVQTKLLPTPFSYRNPTPLLVEIIKKEGIKEIEAAGDTNHENDLNKKLARETTMLDYGILHLKKSPAFSLHLGDPTIYYGNRWYQAKLHTSHKEYLVEIFQSPLICKRI